jgi:transposase
MLFFVNNLGEGIYPMLERLPNLTELSVGEKDSLIVRLFAELDDFQAEVKDLRGKLAKNSQNSSKPPSTDGYNKPKPKSLRRPSGKKSGGQTCHPPARLEMVDLPDHIEPHRDGQCGCSLEAVEASEIRRRQVFDILPLMLEVTEHRAETLGCPGCGCQNEAAFPAAVKTSAQYGSHIKSLLV